MASIAAMIGLLGLLGLASLHVKSFSSFAKQIDNLESTVVRLKSLHDIDVTTFNLRHIALKSAIDASENNIKMNAEDLDIIKTKQKIICGSVSIKLTNVKWKGDECKMLHE